VSIRENIIFLIDLPIFGFTHILKNFPLAGQKSQNFPSILLNDLKIFF
jgi:flagellar assembly factor FliW